jgi:hypothetical protein
MYVKDTVLYRAFYCGLCKSIGNTCGGRCRFALNYDLTFLSVFAHNVLDVDVKINKERCVIHWLKKRPVAKVDDLSKRIGCLNVILAHYKLGDDILDCGKGRIKQKFFRKGYKKAVKLEPVFDRIVRDNFKNLLDYEKKNGDSIDISSDSFGTLMKEIVAELFKDKFTFEIGELCYNLGKWIYIIDALDDFDKDLKKGEYNVFVNAYESISSKKDLLLKKSSDLQFIFGTIMSDINRYSDQIQYKFNHDLIDNVLKKGILEQTKKIMEAK